MRQYDASPAPPTIRSIAAALEVAPSAIYHHFPSHSAIVEACVEAVWNESVGELLGLVANPLEADPKRSAGPAPAEPATDPIRAALDRTMALAAADPAADEEQFVRGLRRLVASLTPA